MMPLNQDLIAANLTVEQLQTFQHVDNVVEVQLQPVPAPPQSTTVVDSSFFDRVNNMMNTFDKLVPLLTNWGSDRRSPTAGPSDIVSPNPIARVPDSAPQGPVVAPQTFIGLFGAACFLFRPSAAASGQVRLPMWSAKRGRQVQRESPCLSFASASLEAPAWRRQRDRWSLSRPESGASRSGPVRSGDPPGSVCPAQHRLRRVAGLHLLP